MPSSGALPVDGDRLAQEQCSLPVGETLSLRPAGQGSILWESGCSDTVLFWTVPFLPCQVMQMLVRTLWLTLLESLPVPGAAVCDVYIFAH